MTGNADRQRAFKKRMADRGLVQVNGWVHPHQLTEVRTLLDRLGGNRDLTVGPIRHESTGRLQKLEKQR